MGQRQKTIHMFQLKRGDKDSDLGQHFPNLLLKDYQMRLWKVPICCAFFLPHLLCDSRKAGVGARNWYFLKIPGSFSAAGPGMGSEETQILEDVLLLWPDLRSLILGSTNSEFDVASGLIKADLLAKSAGKSCINPNGSSPAPRRGSLFLKPRCSHLPCATPEQTKLESHGCLMWISETRSKECSQRLFRSGCREVQWRIFVPYLLDQISSTLVLAGETLPNSCSQICFLEGLKKITFWTVYIHFKFY